MAVSPESVSVPLDVILWVGGIAVLAISAWATTIEMRIKSKLGRREHELLQNPVIAALNRIETTNAEGTRLAEAHREIVRRTLVRVEKNLAVLNDRAGRRPSEDEDTGNYPLREG